MSAIVDAELDALLRHAENERRCLLPSSERVRQDLSRRLGQGKTGLSVVSPIRGVYVRTNYWESLTAVDQAAHLAVTLASKHPTWTFSHYTAAVLRGWSVALSLALPLHAVALGHRRAKDVVFHEMRAGRDGEIPCDTVKGVRATKGIKTLCDCLRSAEFTMALPIADSAIRAMGLSPARAGELLRRDPALRGTRHVRRALEIVRHADALSESGGESFARAVMIELGFEVPELQVEYPDPIEAGRVFRVDYRWVLPDGSVVLGEFDGKGKYVDPTMTKGRSIMSVLTNERLRESHLSALGVRIMRFSYADVLNRTRFAHLLTSFGVPPRAPLRV